MITINRTASDVATVSGAPAEVMLFYCLWQTSLWEDWMKPEGLAVLEAARQHKDAVKEIAEASRLSFSLRMASEKTGFHVAVEKAKAIGVRVLETAFIESLVA